MKFSELNPGVRALWAKSSDDGGHGLLAHMLDVAAVVEALLAREPASSLDLAARALGLPRNHIVRWLAFLIGLHDFGKAIPGFQTKWDVGRLRCESAGLEFPPQACNASIHACATAALLSEPMQNSVPGPVKWVRHAIRAISAHHGFHVRSDQVMSGRPTFEPGEWKTARDGLFQAYLATLAPQGGPSLKKLTLSAINWLAGLTSTADWIASNTDWFPPGERCDDLNAYYGHAFALAEQALDSLGWHGTEHLLKEPSDTATLLRRILGNPDAQPRPLQELGDSLLQGTCGPVLMLVEAPMGEGKTELAFIAHLRLQALKDYRGLYIALPTQATGNAMFRRTVKFLRSFSKGVIDIQLAHGGASFDELATALRTVHLRGIDNDRNASVAASAWFGQKRRPLLSPYGVGTIDQALYATLNVKHHFVRLWGLSNRVVVLDEVHAYDTYTSNLIASLLKWLKAVGSSVVLMSATLPRARRDELLKAWDIGPDRVADTPYPRVLVADESGVELKSFCTREMASIRLAGIDDGLETIAAVACEQLQSGGCGAVIVNTVDRAQKLYTLVRDRVTDDVQLVLFHARFPMEERAVIENRVLSFFGPAGNRPEKALMIATQVAEQSLDFDADFMVSDLAPVDLLFQRAGRLHRHVRVRPATHKDACLWVAGLTGQFPDLKATRWEYVYEPYVLGRTWALLQQESSLVMPGDIDRLVQAVYGDTPLPEKLDVQVAARIETEYWAKQSAKAQHENRVAGYVALDVEMELEGAYEGKPEGNDEDDLLGLRNATRLGEDSIVLIPVDVIAGTWRVGELVFDPHEAASDDLARRLYVRQLRLSRKAVRDHFMSRDAPKAFTEHPLLRNARPLPLEDGRYGDGGVVLRLDPELGLVYE